MALTRIAFRARARDQPLAFELVEHPAEIAGVEIELLGDITGSRRLAVGDLVEQPHLAQRPGRVEKVLSQYADLTRVEAVEAADGGDARGGCSSHGPASLGKLVDLVK